jgi:polar amino acid transport system substrate-binding protein
MKKKWWMLGMSAVVSISLLAGCGTDEDETTGEEPAVEQDEVEPETSEEPKTLVMGTSADYPPYESIDLASGDIIGFDVDIATFITEELGYDLQIEDMDFDGLIPAMGAGRVDFVLAGMTPTEDRKKNADFSDIYFTATNLIVSQADANINSLEDLAGLKVGVQLGSIQEGEAEDLKEEYGFEVIKLNRISEIMQELLSGRIDAILMEDTVAKGHMEAQQQLTSFEIEADEEVGSAIAFPKGSELTESFNEKLNELIDSGKMEELVIKWFDTEE